LKLLARAIEIQTSFSEGDERVVGGGGETVANPGEQGHNFIGIKERRTWKKRKSLKKQKKTLKQNLLYNWNRFFFVIV
jgi:hypothetical protein